jgi:hypothetical protein
MNKFGLIREYFVKPSYVPDLPSDAISSSANATLSAGTEALHPLPQVPKKRTLEEALGPLPNISTFRTLQWCWDNESEGISGKSFKGLVQNVLHDPNFVPTDVSADSFTKYKASVASWCPETFDPTDGWHESAVPIHVPLPSKRSSTTTDPPPENFTFEVEGLHHRSIVGLVKQILSTDPLRKTLHLHPFYEYRVREESQQSAEGPSEILERVYSELFSSTAFMDAYKAVQNHPRPPGDIMEYIVIGLMFWSDETHLTNFGPAKLWPIYMALANQSKYDVLSPSSHAMHDLAHIPQVCHSIISS